MEEFYPGNKEINGEKYDVSEKPNESRRPFKAVLDVGLTRTTTGNRVFGVLKGATDGGLCVPHSVKRFPGYVAAKGEGEKEVYNAASHRERIFGVHIDKYMKSLKSKGEAFKRQFAKWDVCLKENKANSLEELYKKIHEKIRS